MNLLQLLELASEATGSLYEVVRAEDAGRLEQEEISLYDAQSLSADRWQPFLSIVLGSRGVRCQEVEALWGSVRCHRIWVSQGGDYRWNMSLLRVKPTELHDWAKRPQSLILTIVLLQYIEPSTCARSIQQLRDDTGDEEALATFVPPIDARAFVLVGSARTVIAIFEHLKEIDVPPLEGSPR